MDGLRVNKSIFNMPSSTSKSINFLRSSTDHFGMKPHFNPFIMFRLLCVSKCRSESVVMGVKDGKAIRPPLGTFDRNGQNSVKNGIVSAFVDIMETMIITNSLASLNACRAPQRRRTSLFVARFALVCIGLLAAFGSKMAFADTLLFEGAENGLTNVDAQVTATTGYNFISDSIRGSLGAHSFHLVHPYSQNGTAYPVNQVLTLTNAVTPVRGSWLEYQSMLRWAGDGESVHVKVSVNGGAWTDFMPLQVGTSTAGEQNFVPKQQSLDYFVDHYPGQPIRFRFSYEINLSNGYWTQTSDNVGWFLDDIKVVKPDGTAALFESAENGLTNVDAQVTATVGYNLFSTTVFASANLHSFHFAHPYSQNGTAYPVDQVLTLTNAVTPVRGSWLEYQSMLRWAGDGESVHVKVSVNGGAWTDFMPLQVGTSTAGEQIFVLKQQSLDYFVDHYPGQPIRFRFSYEINLANGYWTQTSDNVGWFLDDIKVIAPTGGPINRAPSLTVVGTLNGAIEDEAFPISYATLAAAADESDPDGNVLSFRVEAVSTGTLTKGGVPVTPGSTLLGTGETLVWTPGGDANGTLNAFTVKAYDGQLASAVAVQVRVATAAVNDAPVAQPGTLAVSPLPVAVPGALGASDVDGTLLTFSVVTQPAKGTVTITDATSGAFTYTPNLIASGSDSFTFKATDAAGLASVPATETVTIALDSDGDGLPDLWEIQTFGNLSQNAAEDFDGDGQTNGQEYIAGTNAASASSKFSATVAPTSQGKPEITWPSTEGRIYTVKRVADLGSTWLTVAANVPAAPAAAVTSWTDMANTASQSFYRVEVSVQ